MKEPLMKNSFLNKIVLLTFGIAILTSCSSSTESTQAENGSDLPNYVQAWNEACTKNSISKECTKYIMDMRVSDYLFGENSKDQNILAVDFDGDSFTDDLGRMYCIDGICTADLVIGNYGNSPWDNSLYFELVSENGFYEAREHTYFSTPLNPGLDKFTRVLFDVGRNIDGMEQLWIKDFISEGLEATIQLCKIKEESQTNEFAGITYENCLRLKHNTFTSSGFIPKNG